MKIYNEIVTAQTTGRKCHYCAEKVERSMNYLHMARNRHIFNICGKCLIVIAAKLRRNEFDAATGIHMTAVNRGTRCHVCNENVNTRKGFLYINRNRYIFTLCGECVEKYSNEIVALDPIHKADAMAELI